MRNKFFRFVRLLGSISRFVYRRLTARSRTLPALFVLGAPKCGTTTLYEIIRKHPNYLATFMGVKELDFLHDIPDHSPRSKTLVKRIANMLAGNYTGPLSYRKFFPLKSRMRRVEERTGTRAITGDFSVSYLYCPTAAKRIYDLQPDAKLIIMIRNPVDRVYSEYNMLYNTSNRFEKGKREIRSFSKAIDDQLKDVSYSHFFMDTYLKRSLYEDYIKIYYDLFDKKQIMVIRAEDFFLDMEKVAGQVFAFLDLPVDDLKIDYTKLFKNEGKYMSQMEDETRKFLEEYFLPHNESLNRFLGVDLKWNDRIG
jgi:hypothetical protein